VNGTFSNPSGLVNIGIKGDTLKADVQVRGLAPNTKEYQAVHTDSRCPTAADDTNKDGYVDVVEARAATGGVLFALSDQIGAPLPKPSPGPSPNPTQKFPTSDSNGNYSYTQSASLAALLESLRKPGPNGEVPKLGPQEDLHLERRVVVIHGVPADTKLPPSVQGIGGYSPQQTLPVACGELKMEVKAP
jgi:hypothetical protein